MSHCDGFNPEKYRFDFGDVTIRPVMPPGLFTRFHLYDVEKRKIKNLKITDPDEYTKSIQFDIEESIHQYCHTFRLHPSKIDWHYMIQINMDGKWTTFALLQRIGQIDNKEIWSHTVEYLFMIGFLV